jgi:hypothetical protein
MATVRTDFHCLRNCVSACGQVPCGPKVSDPCENDKVDVDVMAAAMESLANGANEVFLSPQGCIRFTRSSNSVTGIVTEVVSHGGLPVVVWNRSETSSIGQVDADLDGCPEWRAVITENPDTDERTSIFLDIDTATGNLTGRQIEVAAGDSVRISIERADASNALQLVQQFSTPRFIETCLGHTAITADEKLILPDACDTTYLKQELRRALAVGIRCLRDFEHERASETEGWVASDIGFVCGAPRNPNAIAEAEYGGNQITVDWSKYTKYNADSRQEILFHEYLHTKSFQIASDHGKRPHPPEDICDRDQTYACPVLCFRKQDQVSQCTCQACLEPTRRNVSAECKNKCKDFKPPCKKSKALLESECQACGEGLVGQPCGALNDQCVCAVETWPEFRFVCVSKGVSCNRLPFCNPETCNPGEVCLFTGECHFAHCYPGFGICSA